MISNAVSALLKEPLRSAWSYRDEVEGGGAGPGLPHRVASAASRAAGRRFSPGVSRGSAGEASSPPPPCPREQGDGSRRAAELSAGRAVPGPCCARDDAAGLRRAGEMGR